MTTYEWETHWRWPSPACWRRHTCSSRNDPLSCCSLWGLIWSWGSWCPRPDPCQSCEQKAIATNEAFISHPYTVSRGTWLSHEDEWACLLSLVDLVIYTASSPSSTALFTPWSALERCFEALRGERNDPEVSQLVATWHVVHRFLLALTIKPTPVVPGICAVKWPNGQLLILSDDLYLPVEMEICCVAFCICRASGSWDYCGYYSRVCVCAVAVTATVSRSAL